MEACAVLLQDVLKETDDEKVKGEVRTFLSEISQAYRFFVVGAEKSGRTTLLRNCFLEGDEQLLPREETGGIWEIRYGAREAVLQVADGYNRRFISHAILDGIALIDAGGPGVYKREQSSELARGADVILAVFSAENVQEEYTWNFIERNAVGKKVICVLTKSDLYPPEIIEKKKRQLLDYMRDLGMSAPVFAVSDRQDSQAAYREITAYVRRNIIGQNPTEQKRQNNFYALVRIQNTLNESVEKRVRQYAEDKRILSLMEARIRTFYEGQEEKIRTLKDDVARVIREEIGRYRDSILRQFDPKELKRNPNTGSKKVFMDWLRHEVERYETILNNRVSEQTNKVMRHYIAEIDDICRDLQDYLESRDVILADTDAFYGSLAKSRTTAVSHTRQVTLASHEDYMTLLAVSEELFDKVWAARRKRDSQVAVTTTVSTVATGIAGGAAALLLAPEAAAFTAAVVAALVLGTAGYEAGKKLADMLFDGKMEKNTEKYIEEFKTNIEATRELMESRTLERLDELFDSEFRALDKNLLQFRSMTNIDAKNVPLLESRMQEFGSLMEQFEREGTIYEYC